MADWSESETAASLLDRGAQLDQLGASLSEAVAGSGRLIVVEGPAGIGKTAILSALAELAKSQGAITLRARGGFLERDFSHGVARQLFDAQVRSDGGAHLLAGAASQARAALGLTELHRLVGSDAMFAANHGLYWLTVNLADTRPVVLLIDDVHWSDAASLHFLTYLAGRIREIPVLAAVAMRPAEPGSPHDLLDTLRSLADVRELHLEALSEHAADELTRRLSGLTTEAQLRLAVYQVTGGNPFLLTELLRAIADDLDRPQHELASRITHLAPRTVARSVLGRLAMLEPAAHGMAGAVAILDTDSELRHAAAVAGLSNHEAVSVVDALSAAGVFARDRPLRFTHPLVRQAVYEELAPSMRASAHARAARILDADGADPDRVVVHLLRSEPSADLWVVERLRAGATRAIGRGAPEVASRLLRRAVEEPAPAPDRADLLLELGRVALMAAEPDAIDLLTRALAAADNTRQRAAAAGLLGTALTWSGDPGHGLQVLAPAAAESRGVDRESWMLLEAARLNMLSLTEAAATSIDKDLDDALAGAGGVTAAERALLAAATLTRITTLSASGTEILSLADRATHHLMDTGEIWSDEFLITGPVFAYRIADRIALVDQLADAATSHSSRVGSPGAADIAYMIRAERMIHCGEMAELREAARSTVGEGSPLVSVKSMVTALHLLTALVWHGDYDEAMAMIDACALTGQLPPITLGRHLLLVRSRVYAALGRRNEALIDARAAAGRINPGMGVAYGALASAALALHAAGAPLDECQAAARADAALVDRLGWLSASGAATLALGIVASRDEQLELLGHSVSQLEGSPRRLELATALIEYGAALRRTNARAAAREPLQRGMELAYRCGALPLAERARTELLACGARPRNFVVTGPQALTTTERHVARMAADGMSNTEIAQALFVTRKTVESHLLRAFRKLDVRSRGDLAQALSAQS